MPLPTFAALSGLAALAATPAAAVPARTPLATIPLNTDKLVSRVVATRVDFLPGQAMPAHLHTVPVICFVTQGDFLVRIGEQPERSAPQGSVTYEPADATVHYFRNASATEPAQLQCASLAGADDTVLNRMLEQPGAK
jgi:quercetin dioxygenase-like cupin family protein